MNLLEFANRFPDEASCRRYLREKREVELQGKSCHCGCTDRFWLDNVEKWQCSNAGCRRRTNLRSGTIMEKSKMPVRSWFMAIHIMTSMKKSVSALEMWRQLGHKRYQPVWYMMQKIRKAMGKRDAKYQLKGHIEMDDAFFMVVDIPKKDELGNKVMARDRKKTSGRGTDKAKVLIMVESTPVPAQKDPNRKKRKMGFLKMVMVDDLRADAIRDEVEVAVHPESSVITDMYKGYNGLELVVEKHTPVVVPAKEAGKILPWVHTQIANVKRLLLGTHHSINREYLQNYLDEFCYKTNRRNFTSDLFDRMITAGAADTWYY